MGHVNEIPPGVGMTKEHQPTNDSLLTTTYKLPTMRLPTRKSEILRNAQRQDDHHYTREAVERMKRDVERLTKIERPQAAEEVHRTKQMGDLSENAAYQEAKVHLRRVNDRITMLEERLKHAILITPGAGEEGEIRIGSRVTLEANGKMFDFEIVGALETSPGSGRISHLSPLGKLIMKKKVGDTVTLTVQTKNTVYTVLEVS